ncbi:MAG: hypothetical protein LBJ32_01680 [Oscillospiraceae bacterium]|jgi:hypothetical protein|nr:hypothetical protein [Oscillospiraceae bacterium]
MNRIKTEAEGPKELYVKTEKEKITIEKFNVLNTKFCELKNNFQLVQKKNKDLEQLLENSEQNFKKQIMELKLRFSNKVDELKNAENCNYNLEFQNNSLRREVNSFKQDKYKDFIKSLNLDLIVWKKYDVEHENKYLKAKNDKIENDLKRILDGDNESIIEELKSQIDSLNAKIKNLNAKIDSDKEILDQVLVGEKNNIRSLINNSKITISERKKWQN